MNLTIAQKAKMYDSLMVGEKSQASREVNPSKNVEANMRSSMITLISRATESHNPEVRQRAGEIQSWINHNGVDGLTMEHYQVLLNESKQAVALDSNLQSDYETMNMFTEFYNNGTTDEEYQAYEAKVAKEQRSSDNPNEETILVNETTGTKFIQHLDGSLSPYIDKGSEEYLADVSANSDEAFIQSGGAQSSNAMFEGLQDK